MRKSGDWMTIWDDRILEYLGGNDWGSPESIYGELGDETTLRQVRERCRVLCHAGLAAPLIDHASADVFEITGWGQLYLEGTVNAGLIRPIPKPRPPDKVRPDYWAGFV
ncbi:repressor phrH2 [Haloferax sp. S1W]|uniref:repressor phrH2 n=1 Tax=Haloferax sp. S1W TaxID=3377110 RepID=UPI0037CC5B7D